MKKVLVVGSVVLVALVIFGAGVAFSQYQQVSAASLFQGFGPGGMMGRGGYGQVHEYIEQALADKLGMTKADVETQEQAGKSLQQIALGKGIAQADLSTFFAEISKTALAKAVADGVLTQAQADTMLQNMIANGFNSFGGHGMMGGMMGALGARGGYGPMHQYIEQALADKLDMTVARIEEQFAAGKSMYQIVIDKGTAEADVPALLTEVHKTAFAKAVADGVLTQAQADAMLQNMSANGFNYANCPMGAGNGPKNGNGRRGGGMMGPGGMMGGRWNQQQPTATPAP